MQREDIEDVFAPAARVEVRRMFGGQGIFFNGRMVGLEADGVLYLKVDGETEPAFAAQGCDPFTYEARNGRRVVMRYRRLPEAAFEDHDVLRQWFALAAGAAQRSATARTTGRRPRTTTRSSPSGDV